MCVITSVAKSSIIFYLSPTGLGVFVGVGLVRLASSRNFSEMGLDRGGSCFDGVLTLGEYLNQLMHIFSVPYSFKILG
jgi:hypothetical protein